jgi:hypothetical protein
LIGIWALFHFGRASRQLITGETAGQSTSLRAVSLPAVRVKPVDRHYFIGGSDARVIMAYARRYALFTLVGIAGEDDLDAPDLNAPTAPASGAGKPASKRLGRLNGGQEYSPQQFPSGRGAKDASDKFKPILEPEPSAALRDQLAAELGEINSAEEAANWAHHVLGCR